MTQNPMPCPHLAEALARADAPVPSGEGCKECLETGDRWVHLRICAQCGHVGCCDSSPQRHATKHYLHSRHPVARSFEPGEHWAWCHVDHEMIDPPGRGA